MGYANPVEHMGYEAFTAAAADAGVDALLTVDLPPEEVGDIDAALKERGLDNIFLVAPTTPDARIGAIAARARGFIYCVSLKGVTGAGHLDISGVTSMVQSIRAHTDLPVAVGFGIRDAESASAIARVADGVVVGSALVDAVAGAVAEGQDKIAAIGCASDLVAQIRRGIDAVAS
jgi:tryptophan synthase alpha chain